MKLHPRRFPPGTPTNFLPQHFSSPFPKASGQEQTQSQSRLQVVFPVSNSPCSFSRAAHLPDDCLPNHSTTRLARPNCQPGSLPAGVQILRGDPEWI